MQNVSNKGDFMARFTEAQRQKQITQVNALRKQGLSAAKACKKAKVNINNYHYWMRTAKKSTGKGRILKAVVRANKTQAYPKAFAVNLAGGKNQPLVIAIGQPKDIQAALSSLAAMFGGSSA